MRVSTGLIPVTGFEIAFDTAVIVPASYMIVGNEVKAVLTGVVLPKLEAGGTRGYGFSGKLKIVAVSTCDKCLKEVKCNLKADILEEFSKKNPDAWQIFNDSIDFSEAVMANTCALLPMKILCKENCLGLCSICGKDLNEGLCCCEKPLDQRFAVLSSFFNREPSE